MPKTSERYKRHLARIKAKEEGLKPPKFPPINKGGRPKEIGCEHRPTPMRRGMVKRCRELGMTLEQTEHITGITRKMLVKYYQPELDAGLAEGIRQVAETVFAAASNPDHKDWSKKSEFYLKTVGKWKETTGVEMGGPGGGALQIEQKPTFDPRLLSYEDREALEQILRKALPNPNVTDAEFEEVEEE